MSRSEILLIQREELLMNLIHNNENRAKLLAELIDIDDELEEITNVDSLS